MTTTVAWCWVVFALLAQGTATKQAPSDPPRLARTQIISVDLGIQERFLMSLPSAGPNASAFVPIEVEGKPQHRRLVFRINSEGKVETTFDIARATGDQHLIPRFCVDSSGKLYWVSPETSDKDLRPSVFIFEEDGSFSEQVTLSKPFRPRQMVVTSSSSWVFSGSVREARESHPVEIRTALLEFNRKGQFVREIDLKDEKDSDADADSEDVSLASDLSILLPDSTGGFFLIRATKDPVVFRVASDGEVLARRVLPSMENTYVIGAVQDGEGRLVLDRATVATMGKSSPEKKVRALMILDAGSLDTLSEASWEEHGVSLFGVANNEFLFLGRRDPKQVEILKASVY